MLKFFVGNRQEVVELIRTSTYTQPCCGPCQKRTPNCCYGAIELCLVQFFTLRPALFLFLAIIEQFVHHSPVLQLIVFMTSASLIVAMIALLRSYNFMIERTKSLAPTKKVLFIKAIILILVIENLIVSSQQETGMFDEGHDKEEDNASKFDSFRRWYAAAGIIETFVFSFLLQTIFKFDDPEDLRVSLTAAAREAPAGTFYAFVTDIFKLWTIIWTLPYSPQSPDNDSATMSHESSTMSPMNWKA